MTDTQPAQGTDSSPPAAAVTRPGTPAAPAGTDGSRFSGATCAARPTVVLASASPARRAVLRAAGLDPVVRVADVDEPALLDELAARTPTDRVLALAAAKSRDVAARLDPHLSDAVVIGCDSMLLLDDALVGKPADEQEARRCWLSMAGRTGTLLTGHVLLRVVDHRVTATAEATASTDVRLGTPTDAEVSAYIATGEPLAVAGALTIDGFGGWFVDGVTGDPSNVIGISLPLTRRLLADLGIAVTDLWRVV